MNGRRDAILREMGLGPIWRLRSGSAEQADPAETAELVNSTREAELSAPSRPESPPETESLGRRLPAETVAGAAPSPVVAQRSLPSDLDWDDLEARIRECRDCALCEKRRQAVPGVGDRNADWMFVGEGPGAEEDARGEPFVGQAGKLLDNMLAAIGLERGHNVYIANAVKCRPPRNRTPEASEVEACLPYLARQIELVRPRLLIALGRPAAQALLKEEVKISAARGKRFAYQDIPVLVTYHPAYLLRNPFDKGKAWQDLCYARSVMASVTKD